MLVITGGERGHQAARNAGASSFTSKPMAAG
jgi:hypothetical protein